jgi:hypothetical protein
MAHRPGSGSSCTARADEHECAAVVKRSLLLCGCDSNQIAGLIALIRSADCRMKAAGLVKPEMQQTCGANATAEVTHTPASESILLPCGHPVSRGASKPRTIATCASSASRIVAHIVPLRAAGWLLRTRKATALVRVPLLTSSSYYLSRLVRQS